MASQQMRNNFRPLAPKGTEIEVSPPSRSPEETRTKRASTACGECKLRRTKCTVDENGGPCHECVFHNRECVIDELADKRRKVAARETEESLKRTQQLLETTQRDLQHYRLYSSNIISMIRYSNKDHIERLVDVIRRGSTNQEIEAFIGQYVNVFPQFSIETPRISDSPEEDGVPGTYGNSGPPSR